MKVKLIILMLLLCLFSNVVLAQTNIELSIPDICATPRDSVEIIVDMVNPVSVWDISFLLILDPQSVSILKRQLLRKSICGGRRCGLSWHSESGGFRYSCGCFPIYDSMMCCNDPLMKVTIELKESMMCGDQLPIQFSDVTVHSWDEPFDSVEIKNGTVFVFLKGDVNLDCKVNVLDVVNTTRIITAAYEPEGCERWAADWNSDEEINALDVIGIVNIILGVIECEP